MDKCIRLITISLTLYFSILILFAEAKPLINRDSNLSGSYSDFYDVSGSSDQDESIQKISLPEIMKKFYDKNTSNLYVRKIARAYA